ncbi:MAG: hypothetical protein EOS63_29390 [Mesorhizobium sp.]|uniref:hypothetical protein n=1 Tax=Mesorhizobium sp. TaxID=1871066 RepID=UPI000FEA3773|nr:hypothetical protein [Mesorhizobium sp.]RWE72928.1 MAG: hypothetical protein EOS63_29390 [Mesorhizobium sp.]TJW62313.1 MAG: hypothetical protein E5V97_17470 [Mesorhizobium sp.]
MTGGLLTASAEYLRSREFIERLTATRLLARQAMAEGRRLDDAELAANLDLDPPIAALLFAFVEAWDISEQAIAHMAVQFAPSQEIRH